MVIICKTSPLWLYVFHFCRDLSTFPLWFYVFHFCRDLSTFLKSVPYTLPRFSTTTELDNISNWHTLCVHVFVLFMKLVIIFTKTSRKLSARVSSGSTFSSLLRNLSIFRKSVLYVLAFFYLSQKYEIRWSIQRNIYLLTTDSKIPFYRLHIFENFRWFKHLLPLTLKYCYTGPSTIWNYFGYSTRRNRGRGCF